MKFESKYSFVQVIQHNLGARQVCRRFLEKKNSYILIETSLLEMTPNKRQSVNRVSIGIDNGLSPILHQAII